MIFWLGFFAGGLATVLACLVAAHLLPRDNKLAKRHIEIVEAQLRVFNERMVEERRLACALETMVEHGSSHNKQSTPCPKCGSPMAPLMFCTNDSCVNADHS